jgi:hypothetical protein
MNQHITKLVRQALNECVSTPVESVIASRIDDHGIVEIPNSFAEKFAELIVRECVSIVDNAERGGSNDVWDNAVKFIRRDLQEHFGVEE